MDKKEFIAEVYKNAFVQFQQNALQKFGDPFYFNDKCIYHYTTSVGLKGIIENNCLWATNLSYVNDSKELSVGLDVYKQVSKKLCRKLKIEPAKKILNSFIHRLNQKNMSSRYACCFTVNSDQLSQWRGYGLNGQGYSIGFETNGLIGNLEPYAEPSRIIYDLETQKVYAEFHIEQLLNSILKAIESTQLNPVDYLNDFTSILEQEAEFTILGFKHTGFSEESENRFHLSNPGKEQVLILEKNGILIPYVELKMHKGLKLPVRRVTIGPTADYERAKKGVEFLLEKNGFPNVEVLKSEIPFHI